MITSILHPAPPVDDRHSLSTLFEQSYVRQSDNSGELLGFLPIGFTAEADTTQLTQIAHNMPLNFLGSSVPTVICVETSESQDCFCLPRWSQSQGKLNLQAFHLPGVCMATSKDREHGYAVVRVL